MAAALKARKTTRVAGLAVYRRANASDCARLALIVPKRMVPNAVMRNRIRRLAREAFRLDQGCLSGWDYVVRVTRPLDEKGVCLADFQALMKRAVDA